MMLWFYRIRKRGQITPFLIAVIVILLSTIMLTVNVGKVSMTKTNTANAADAGALAGASAMATGLCNIKDSSSNMFMETVTYQVMLLICPMHSCLTAWKLWYTWLILQWSQIGLAQYNAIKALGDADDMAKELAFSNAGIDEAKPRNSGETYEAWLQRKSNLTEWMEHKHYTSGNYTWNDTVKYGQSSTSTPGRNWVSVSVDKPTWIVVPLYLPLFYSGLLPTIPPTCCFNGGLNIWGIALVIGDTNPIEVKVTRVEPHANLGLWNMTYYEGEKEVNGITSSAKAHAFGGMVLPFGPDYDSELTEAR